MLKEKLYAACLTYVSLRLETASAAMEEAQDSANSETKSTAGDKHDTARAMMQLAAEQNAKHLAEAYKLQQALKQLNPKSTHSKAEVGSLIEATNGNFYLSISAGKIEIDGVVYFAISPSSPMGQLFLGHVSGDEVRFNNNLITIKAIQ